LDLLLEVAPEIPVDLHGERKELLSQQIHADCVYRGVWIALDGNKQIVGFLLAERQQQEIKLPYGGVTNGHREHHIFRKLIDNAKAMAKAAGVPLTAVVLHKNTSQMVNVLRKLGFAKVSSLPDRDNLRWQPPARQS
jgi:Acetyltransferase (GNAT) domain